MSLAALHPLVPVLAAAGEKSKTAFYIAGFLLAVWAVVVSVIGITRPEFPPNVLGSRGVMGLSAVLVAATVATAVLTASKPRKAGEAKAATPAPSGTVAVAADPSGQLSYDRKSLVAKAGPVRIDFTDSSPVAHNVTIQQGGRNVAATQTITQSKATVTTQLKPGTYTFYCSVDGHRQAGMVGTLKVS